MPYRREHSCTINEEVTEELVVVEKETPLGVFKFVKGLFPNGTVGLRAVRIPAEIPINEGNRICGTMGGVFSPATPLDPRKQLLSENWCVSCVRTLVKDFEMPFDVLQLSEEMLPTSDRCYMLGHRELPYKFPDGTISKLYVQKSLQHLNCIDAKSEVKLTALRGLLRLCRVYGIKVEEKPHFRLSDLDFYLTVLSEVENMEEEVKNIKDE